VKLVVTDAQSTDSLIREDYIHVTLCCPEDPNDRGACDTLSVVCLDCETDSPPPGIRSVRYILLVTHDQVNEIDSLAGFVVPLSWTHTNPSAYCSLGAYWNTTSTLWDAPNFERSIFRHVVEDADTLYHNRMADLAADYSGRDWDTRILDLSSNDDSSYMRMGLFSTGTADQRWWEGERVLLATLTFRMQDTMHVCIDSSFWPPASHLNFIRDDGVPYVPRDNLPCCFRIDMLTVDGDANGDGVVDPGDVVYSINYLFRDGAPPVPLESGDANCDGHMGPGDIVYLLNYLFRNGPAPCG
jgi:hypothetical protein